MVKMTRNVLWNRPSGSVRRFECWSSAAATQGCVNWSREARPAPRKSADSRLMRQLRDEGPKSPSRGFGVVSRTEFQRDSMLLRETGDGVVIGNSNRQQYKNAGPSTPLHCVTLRSG